MNACSTSEVARMNRRGFLNAILASGVAPYVSTAAGVLMPVKVIDVPMTATEVIRRHDAFIDEHLKAVVELLTFGNAILVDMPFTDGVRRVRHVPLREWMR